MKLAFFPRTTLVAILLSIGLGPFAIAEEATAEVEKTKPAPPPPCLTTEPDPFAETSVFHRKPTVPDERLGVKLPTVFVRLEIWEIPALELAKRLDGIVDSKGIEQLRNDMLSGKAGGKLIASPACALDPSSIASSESISEWIYPTEYVPPELPPVKAGDKSEPTEAVSSGKKIPVNQAFVCPTAFETRNTGMTMEAIARQVTVEASTWDVAICFESVERPGDLHYGNPKDRITVPLFTNFRVQGTYRCRERLWQWAAIHTSPKGITGDGANRWVCLLRLDPISQ